MGQQAVAQKNSASSTLAPIRDGLLQRQCACGSHTIAGGECTGCGQERDRTSQRFALGRGLVSGHDNTVTRSVNQGLRLPGQSLGAASRTSFGTHSGHDFSSIPTHTPTVSSHASSGGRALPTGVKASLESQFHAPLSSARVHDNPSAASLTRKHQANAMTIGEDIHFAKGRYRPTEASGRNLLVHELTHVLQQRGGSARNSISESEAEARSVAARSVNSVAPLRVQQNIRASQSAPLLDPSTAREVLEDELDDVFCNVKNAWPLIQTAPQAERDGLRNDPVLERNIRRRASAMELLKTYLLFAYQTEDQFPAHYATLIEATDFAGTHEARIYSLLRGVDQLTRDEMQKMPGVVEVIEDEMSGDELQLALRLLYEGEVTSGKEASTALTSTHLEKGKRYILDINARQGFEPVQTAVEEAITFGHEDSDVILEDSSLWAAFADEYNVEEVWYLRMIARYKSKGQFPVADTQTESFVKIIWESVEGGGTKEEKLTTGLEGVNKAKAFKSGGGGRALKSPPDEVKDDPWFVPVLQSELSGDELDSAMNAVTAKAAAPVAIREDLRKAINKKDMTKIRDLMTDVKLSVDDRHRLQVDPVILSEMGDELSGAQLCETSQLLEYGVAIPGLVYDLLAFFQGKVVDVTGAVAYLTKLTAADQNQLLKEPGVYFMLTDTGLGAERQKLLAAIRSKDKEWQTPGSEGLYTTYKESVSTTLPISFTSSEARISMRMNIDTKLVPVEGKKPFKVDSGTVEDWIRKIDDVWNNKYRIRSGVKKLALVFDPYMAHGIPNPDVSVVVENREGRSWAQYPEMHLFLDGLDSKTVAHEFGHILGNPDEYKLTPAEYLRIGKKAGTSPAPMGGEDLEGLMASQYESVNIEARHVGPAVEVINKVRDVATYPAAFVPEKT